MNKTLGLNCISAASPDFHTQTSSLDYHSACEDLDTALRHLPTLSLAHITFCIFEMNKGSFCSFHNILSSRILPSLLAYKSFDCYSIINSSLDLTLISSYDWAILIRPDEITRNRNIELYLTDLPATPSVDFSYIRSSLLYREIYSHIFETSSSVRPLFLRHLLTTRAASLDVADFTSLFNSIKAELSNSCSLLVSDSPPKHSSQLNIYPTAYSAFGKIGHLDGAHRRSCMRFLGYSHCNHVVYELENFNPLDFHLELSHFHFYPTLCEYYPFYLNTLSSLLVNP